MTRERTASGRKKGPALVARAGPVGRVDSCSRTDRLAEGPVLRARAAYRVAAAEGLRRRAVRRKALRLLLPSANLPLPGHPAVAP